MRKASGNTISSSFEPREIRPGGSTAQGGVAEYRLEKLARLGILHGRWLDCGCCDGAYTVGLVERGAREAVGSDVDNGRLAQTARSWACRSDVGFVTAAGERLPIADASFEGVLLNEVLEHVTDQDQTLAELRRVLAPGGSLAVFSPNRWFPFEGHGMVVGSKNFASPVPLVPWLPRRLSLRVMKARNYWPHELRDLIAAAGFEIVRVDFAFPLFSHYRWFPAGVIRRYQASVPRLERTPFIRRFGVSTLVVGRKPRA